MELQVSKKFLDKIAKFEWKPKKVKFQGDGKLPFEDNNLIATIGHQNSPI